MKIFLFYFEMAIKITGSAQNYRVGRVSGNTPIFLGLVPWQVCLRVTNVYSESAIVFRQSIMKVSSKSLDYLQIFFSNSKVD